MMDQLNLSLAVLGVMLLTLSFFSAWFKRSTWFSQPILAMAVGVAVSPVALGWLDVRSWGDEHLIMEQAARLTLAIGVMGVALRLPPWYPMRRWRSLVIMLGVVMPVMAAVSAGLVWAVLGPLVGAGVWVALLIGAAVAPTDPVIASSIVTGNFAQRHLPAHLRNVISAEAGANDGLALPLVLLPLMFVNQGSDGPWTYWLVEAVLRDVLLSVLIGGLIGLAAGWTLRLCERLNLIDDVSLLGLTLAVSLGTLGIAKLAGADGVLAVFAAGVTFAPQVAKCERAQETRVQDTVNRFFTLPVFALLGLMLPWEAWSRLGAWVGVLAAGILLLRRLPAVWLLRRWVPELRRPGDAVFAGWFGPIGIAAIFYAMVAHRELSAHEHEAVAELPWAVVSLTVVGSILLHGLTATAATRLYASRCAANDPGEEKKEPQMNTDEHG